MATSRVKTNLFLTFEIAAKWKNVCYTQQSYKLISLNQSMTAGLRWLTAIWVGLNGLQWPHQPFMPGLKHPLIKFDNQHDNQ